ncbi:hypothetical protein ACSCX3_000869 [Enterobacter hormaechei]
MKTLEKYYSALRRLIENKSLVLPIGTKISYDSVALEAGQSKGSIKKSRPGFSELIKEIDKHKGIRNIALDQNMKTMRQEILDLKTRLNASLVREVNLLNELHELRTKD